MVNPADTQGKRIAMAVWSKNPDGSDDVMVVTGIASWDGTRLTMIRESDPPFRVEHQWLSRLKPVEAELKESFLGAEYYFSVTTSPALVGLRHA